MAQIKSSIKVKQIKNHIDIARKGDFSYRVLSAVNCLNPKIDDVLSEDEVSLIIRRGCTVNIISKK